MISFYIPSTPSTVVELNTVLGAMVDVRNEVLHLSFPLFQRTYHLLLPSRGNGFTNLDPTPVTADPTTYTRDHIFPP